MSSSKRQLKADLKELLEQENSGSATPCSMPAPNQRSLQLSEALLFMWPGWWRREEASRRSMWWIGALHSMERGKMRGNQGGNQGHGMPFGSPLACFQTD